MFKTIYSKYLVSFIALLGIGFLCISIIICAVVSSYSMDAKTEVMNKTAQMVYIEISNEMKAESCGFSDAISNNKERFNEIFSLLSDYSESNILLVSSGGNVLLENGAEAYVKQTKLSEKTLNEIRKDAGHSRFNDLGGLFEQRRFNYIYSVENASSGKAMGYIILTSGASGMSQVFEQIIKVIILSSLWVFLAAIIIVYFITDRITTPIKQISKAVKSYAKGNFNVRIPVEGEDEIATLSIAFNNMAADLSKLEKTRNTFFSSVSHDLKTPMTSIQGFIEGILDGTIPEEKHSYYLGIVLEEVKRLTRLVNSLLDITRMQSGSVKLNPEKFDVCEMARLILISFEEKIEELKLDVEFNCDDDPSTVFADKEAIHQVLYNIVSNAMKFTPEGGKLKIDITKEKSNEKYLVSVYNSGIGIKEDELPFVFDSFYKADSSRGLDKTGTGLGMFIAKSKIEAHGEKISVESEYEKYCRFYFTLSSNEKHVQKMICDK